MKKRPLLALCLLLVLSATGYTFYKRSRTADDMTAAASHLLSSLSKEERALAQMPYKTPQRMGWHFIPKNQRKGLQIKDMSDEQRKRTHTLLRSALSQAGYDKSVVIMKLEGLLHTLESKRGGGRNIRDPLRYYVTIFGNPSSEGRWGLSFEGHHVSLNFVVEGPTVISSTPQFLAANPAVVRDDYDSPIKKGTRVLNLEETLAFQLVQSLSDEQRKSAILADKAPREIRNAGEAQPPRTAAEGLAASDLENSQRQLLQGLIDVYISAMPADVAAARSARLKEAGFDKIHFAWAGPTEPGIGHYYRVQGPTFLIEFVNTQPDAAGNPANHVHCVWRDPHGDFGVPATKSDS